MTKDKALQMAINALTNCSRFEEAIQACKEALEQPAQEPVKQKVKVLYEKNGIQTCEILPAPSWQGLSDDEIQAIRIKTFDAVATNYKAYRAIEQALKEKNFN